MNYRYSLLTPLLLLSSAGFVHGATKTPDTSFVRQMIGREKVVAFSKDYLIKSGLEDKDLAKWDATIKTSLGYITPSKKEELLPNADRLFYTLDNANAFVKETVKKLTTTYGPLYKKEGNAYVPHFENSTITSSDIKNLGDLNTQAKELREKVIAVAQAAFPRSYVDAQPAPEAWVKMYINDDAGKIQSAEALFPEYLEFLRDYAAVNHNYNDFKRIYSTRYGLIKQKPSETDKEIKKREDSFAALLEKIERCVYRLGEKKLSGGKERTLLTKFANEIRAEFPGIYSTLDFYKIPKSTSMQRTVLSAYSEAMEGVLNQIIRETNTLLADAKAKTGTYPKQPQPSTPTITVPPLIKEINTPTTLPPLPPVPHIKAHGSV